MVQRNATRHGYRSPLANSAVAITCGRSLRISNVVAVPQIAASAPKLRMVGSAAVVKKPPGKASAG